MTTNKQRPLTYWRMRCCHCDVLIPPGDKDKDPTNYARVGLPEGVTYNPKRHSPGACVDCYLAVQDELAARNALIEQERMWAAMEKEHFGFLSPETIKREIEAGRMDATRGLYEFMASKIGGGPL